MKIRTQDSRHGGILVAALIVSITVGMMLIAYLAMVSNQHKFSQRSQVWNNSLAMCEAGMEEALAHINNINTTSNFAVNGWTKIGTNYYKSRDLNGGTIRMSIDTSMPPVIMVTGILSAPVQSGTIIRRVKVKTKINQKFPNGVLGKGLVDMGGGGRVDSFNAALPGVESDALGQYNVLFATDRVSVATVSQIVGNLTIGNGEIYGTAATGPG